MIKKIRILFVVFLLSSMILLFILNNLMNWINPFFVFYASLSLLAMWKYLLDYHLYICVRKYGAGGNARVISCKKPFFVGPFPSGNLRGSRWINLTSRYATKVVFDYESYEMKLEIWGAFLEPPAEVGDVVDVIYWSEYENVVILSDPKYQSKYLKYTIGGCILFAAIAVLLVIISF